MFLSPVPSNLENPQNPHHPDVTKSTILGEGVPGIDRACKIQGSARQGPGAAADQELEGYDEENPLRRGQQDVGYVRDEDSQALD